MPTVRVASVQTDVVFANPTANTGSVISHLESLSKKGVDLVVFPECGLTGYCVNSIEEATRIALESTSIASDTHPVKRIQDAVNRLGILAVVGLAERLETSSGSTEFRNTAVLFEPNVPIRSYRKTHLPELGYDKFVTPGDELVVFETRLGRIGLLICFDLRPPEAMRALALQNADLVCLPTNWPNGAQISADTISIARAVENKVFLVTCNRIGTENGVGFIGKSKIIDPLGRILAAADDNETVLIADLDFELARQKRIVNIPGEYEMTVFESRRPELYGEITVQRTR